MIPFTATAHLSTPPVLDFPLMFDAALLAGLGATRGAQHPSGWADLDDFVDEPLPLATVEAAGSWWYACSQVTPAGTEAADFVNRVPAIEEYSRWVPNRSVNVAAGPDKRMRKPFYYRPELTQLAWTGVGDVRAVAALLARVSAVGRLRTQGWGAIRRWEITSGGPPLDAYRDFGLRHVPSLLPLGQTDGVVTRRRVPLRPPYWRRSDGVDCWQQVRA